MGTETLRQYCGKRARRLMLRPHTPDMERREHRKARAGLVWGLTNPVRAITRAASVTPISLAALVRSGLTRHWRTLLVLVGFLVQVVLTVLMWHLVDLTISLMEVWAELARKHLEITLS
jgi:hypothetical protein